MKLKPKIRKKKSGRGRPIEVGGPRTNFYPGQDLIDAINSFNKKMFDMGIKQEVSQSYVFRKGGWLYLKQMNADLDKATRGEYHAKKRDAKQHRSKVTVKGNSKV